MIFAACLLLVRRLPFHGRGLGQDPDCNACMVGCASYAGLVHNSGRGPDAVRERAVPIASQVPMVKNMNVRR